MISVIICSIRPELLEKLQTNIAATIGAPYEIVAVDNRDTGEGICKVYNRAAAAAKFDVLCFLHEDLILHTKNWGNVLATVFADKKTGLAGISGAVFKSKYPATWSACDPRYYRTNSIQHFRGHSTPEAAGFNPGNETLSEVAVIDGVFMATTKKVFEQYRFDEVLLTGFHGYDLDYSLQVGSGYKVVVTHEIMVEHLSEGNLNKTWLDNSIALHKKWSTVLPMIKTAMSSTDIKRNDYMACCSVIYIALKNPGYKKLVFRYYLKLLSDFFLLNKLKYSRSVMKYILQK